MEVSDLRHQAQAMMGFQSPLPIESILKDNNVKQLFKTQLNLLPLNVYSLYVAYEKIYIIINLNSYLKLLQSKQQQEKDQHDTVRTTDVQSKYAIKVSKNFPLKNSLKLHLLDGSFQPKISDCRDLFQQVMGSTYTYSMHFIDILKALVEFDKKLHHMNQLFQQMQKLGNFNLGQRYYYSEICQLYPSVFLFKDLNKKKSTIYLGLTETHILTFKQQQEDIYRNELAIKRRHTVAGPNQKQVIQNGDSECTSNELVLICCAEMQCIDTIYYKENQKILRIIYKKYRSIKLYHQFQEIKRHYKFSHPQIFLRGVLKSISKFQPCEILFQPYTDPNKKETKPQLNQSIVEHRKAQRINYFIEETNRLELVVKKQMGEADGRKNLDEIEKCYRKLIQYYSARANPYYLIYVNKLNTLYSKYFLKKSLKVKESKSS